MAITAGSTTKKSISRTAKIGIGIGSTTIFLIGVLAVFWFVRRHLRDRRRTDQQTETRSSDSSARSGTPSVPVAQEIAIRSLIDLGRELPDNGRLELHDMTRPRAQACETPSRCASTRVHELQEPCAPIAHELQSPNNHEHGIVIQDQRAKSKTGIIVSTNMTRQSCTGEIATTEIPCVKTTISSPKCGLVNLNRSLPATPISESPQCSPQIAAFARQIRKKNSSDTSLALSALQDLPLNAWQRSLRRPSLPRLSYTSMDMEIVIPPGVPDVEVVKPLSVRKKNGRKRGNFF